MPKFKYVVKNAKGEKVSAEIEAFDKNDPAVPLWLAPDPPDFLDVHRQTAISDFVFYFIEAY